MAQGIALASTKSEAIGKIYNMTRCASKQITLLDAAALCIKIVGKGKIDIQDKDPHFPSRGRLNIDRARLELGYNPVINVKEGFKRYHKWFKESAYWQQTL